MTTEAEVEAAALAVANVRFYERGHDMKPGAEIAERFARAALTAAEAVRAKSAGSGVITEAMVEALSELQSWLMQQRTSLVTGDPDFFAKHDTFKVVGQKVRDMKFALEATLAKEPQT